MSLEMSNGPTPYAWLRKDLISSGDALTDTDWLPVLDYTTAARSGTTFIEDPTERARHNSQMLTKLVANQSTTPYNEPSLYLDGQALKEYHKYVKGKLFASADEYFSLWKDTRDATRLNKSLQSARNKDEASKQAWYSLQSTEYELPVYSPSTVQGFLSLKSARVEKRMPTWEEIVQEGEIAAYLCNLAETRGQLEDFHALSSSQRVSHVHERMILSLDTQDGNAPAQLNSFGMGHPFGMSSGFGKGNPYAEGDPFRARKALTQSTVRKDF
ncbi:uncharacterized protein L199_002048 [Kwoniella botswanensis]|uniref:uncharacterized protein n=1 Tax=Kwoniella botswanensis TaxID=1268659 RepID=UPI00315CAF02